MFDKDRFIQDCMNAVAEGQGAIREIVTEAVSDSVGVMSELGEPEHAGITPIYRSHDLTIINFVWAPSHESHATQSPDVCSCRYIFRQRRQHFLAKNRNDH